MSVDKMYETAFALKNSVLWKKLPPNTVFAIHAGSGLTYYCTAVGKVGRDGGAALCVWPGQSGLDALRSGDAMLADCYQCRFDSLLSLEEDELKSVTSCADRLKLSLRGANPCPRFMRCLPYRAPVVITSRSELALLDEAMQAALYVAEMLKKHTPTALGFLPEDLSAGAFVPCLELFKKEYNWWQVILPPVSPVISDPTPYTDPSAANRLLRRRKHGSLQCAFVHLPIRVPDDENVLCNPATLIAVLNDESSNRMFATQPKPDGQLTFPWLLDELASQLVGLRVTPAEIIVADQSTEALLTDFCRRCGLRLTRSESLPALDHAAAALTAMLKSGKLK